MASLPNLAHRHISDSSSDEERQPRPCDRGDNGVDISDSPSDEDSGPLDRGDHGSQPDLAGGDHGSQPNLAGGDHGSQPNLADGDISGSLSDEEIHQVALDRGDNGSIGSQPDLEDGYISGSSSDEERHPRPRYRGDNHRMASLPVLAGGNISDSPSDEERHPGPLDRGDNNTMASLSDTAGGDVAVSSSNEERLPGPRDPCDNSMISLPAGRGLSDYPPYQEVPNTFYCQIWNYLVLIGTLFVFIIGFTILLAILIALPGAPIAAIVIGANYLRSCPAQPFIPIYLIVWGSSAITDILLSILQNSNSKAKESKIIKVLQMVLFPFTTAWCIGGSVMVYNIDNKFSTDLEAGNFCDSILYSFAFWMPIACLILFGMLCVFVCLIAYREKKLTVILRQTRRSLGQP